MVQTLAAPTLATWPLLLRSRGNHTCRPQATLCEIFGEFFAFEFWIKVKVDFSCYYGGLPLRRRRCYIILVLVGAKMDVVLCKVPHGFEHVHCTFTCFTAARPHTVPFLPQSKCSSSTRKFKS